MGQSSKTSSANRVRSSKTADTTPQKSDKPQVNQVPWPFPAASISEISSAKLASLLGAIDIKPQDLAGIRRLYEHPAGFPYEVDRKNAPQGETINASRRVGSAVKRALGISSALPYGMSFVGYCDSKTSSWRMKPEFRDALKLLGWFDKPRANQPLPSPLPAKSDNSEKRAPVRPVENLAASTSVSGNLSLQQLKDELDNRVQQSQKDSPAVIAERLKKANPIPSITARTVMVYDRNPDVITQVLRDANGYCQECKRPAPFLRKSDNSPYLEVHHRIPLASGGEDTVQNAVALCPNCHRKMHYGQSLTGSFVTPA